MRAQTSRALAAPTSVAAILVKWMKARGGGHLGKGQMAPPSSVDSRPPRVLGTLALALAKHLAQTPRNIFKPEYYFFKKK